MVKANLCFFLLLNVLLIVPFTYGHYQGILAKKLKTGAYWFWPKDDKKQMLVDNVRYYEPKVKVQYKRVYLFLFFSNIIYFYILVCVHKRANINNA